MSGFNRCMPRAAIVGLVVAAATVVAASTAQTAAAATLGSTVPAAATQMMSAPFALPGLGAGFGDLWAVTCGAESPWAFAIPALAAAPPLQNAVLIAWIYACPNPAI